MSDPLSHEAADVDVEQPRLAAPEVESELPDDERDLAGDGGSRGGGIVGGGDAGGHGGGGGDDSEEMHPAPRPGRVGPHRNRIVAFVQGSWRELQRVQWPDQRQVVQATGVVIGFVIVAGAYLGLADWVATKIVNLIL
jgi:preprotein translocase SecE subunit